MESWERKGSRPRGDYRVFTVREDHVVSPVSGDEYRFFVIEANDWINVIPITTDGRLVCVRQYRHGTQEITLEIPGGVVDDGEGPLAAAERELIEETGYEPDEMVYLGTVDPNPAIQNNRCHTYLAKNCRLVREQNLDGAEEIDVELIDPGDVPALVREGKIAHALVVAAFYLFNHAGATNVDASSRHALR